jgi:hypothetical protein
MSDAIRWLALFPDPVTGLDQPVRAEDGTALSWVAPNREYAIRLVRRELTPIQAKLVSVVSAVDWAARKHTRQRPKLSFEPGNKPRFVNRNPDRICQTCGTEVSPSAFYCAEHRSQKRRKQYTDSR